jgi:hypothetical protein
VSFYQLCNFLVHCPQFFPYKLSNSPDASIQAPVLCTIGL